MIWQLLLLIIGLFTFYIFSTGKVENYVEKRRADRITKKQQTAITVLVKTIATHVSNSDSAETTRKQLIQNAYSVSVDSLQIVLDSLYRAADGAGLPTAQDRKTDRSPGKASHSR